MERSKTENEIWLYLGSGSTEILDAFLKELPEERLVETEVKLCESPEGNSFHIKRIHSGGIQDQVHLKEAYDKIRKRLSTRMGIEFGIDDPATLQT